jgi:lysophospholipase L1-like esterase
MTLEEILANIMSMSELARVHNIEVILCSVLPAVSFSWRPELHPAADIARLNLLIKNYASKSGFIYLDYYSAMVGDNQGLQDRYTYDGVHPNGKGYQVMQLLAEQAIAKALNH